MKNETTKRLEEKIYSITSRRGTFGCFEVTIGWYGKERVDYLTYDTNGVFKCYEIKSSVADFRSQWSHSFVGHYNYYVLTQEVYNVVKKEIPDDVGIYIEDQIIKRAKRRKLAVDERVLKDSLIRSLHREADKLHKVNDENYTVALKGELAETLKELNKLKSQYNDMLTYIYRTVGYDWQFDYNDYYMNTTKKEREKNMVKEINKAREMLRKEKRKKIEDEDIEDRERRIYKYLTRYE